MGTVAAVGHGLDCNCLGPGKMRPYTRNRPCNRGQRRRWKVVQGLGVAYVPRAFELRELWENRALR